MLIIAFRNEAAWCYLEGFGGKKDKVSENYFLASLLVCCFPIRGAMVIHSPAASQNIKIRPSVQRSEPHEADNLRQSSTCKARVRHTATKQQHAPPARPSSTMQYYWGSSAVTTFRLHEMPPNTASTIPIQLILSGSIILWAAMHKQIRTFPGTVEHVYLALVTPTSCSNQ